MVNKSVKWFVRVSNFTFMFIEKHNMSTITVPVNNMRTAEFKTHRAKCVLHCHQSCHRPLRKQAVQYFRGFKRSHSLLVIGRFQSILLVSACMCPLR